MNETLLLVQSPYNKLATTLNFGDIFKYAKKHEYDRVVVVEENSLYGLFEATRLSAKYGVHLIYCLKLKVSNDLNNLILVPRNEEGMKSIIKLSSLIMTDNDINLSSIKNDSNYLKNLYLLSLDQIPNLKTTIYTYAPSNESFWLPLISSNENSSIAILKTYNNELTYPLYSLENFVEITNSNQDIYYETSILFNKIKFVYELPQYSLPQYKFTKGLSSNKFLYELSSFGLTKRLNNKVNKQYSERLLYELKVINDLNFSNYFLIVYDIVKWAKQNNILVGPARGSSAGSLVAYTLGITDIDPIKFDLLFERFLNHSRHELPDIDLDFPDDKRDLVIKYMQEKYGREHVYSISNYANYGLSKALTDYLKPLMLDERRQKGIISSINRNTLDETDLEAYNAYIAANLVKDNITQVRTHPAGIIVTNESLFGAVPFKKGSLNLLQIAYNHTAAESIGLVKIDLLALKTLTLINEMFELLNAKFRWDRIPLDHQKTYELLSSGKTEFIFQLESGGMRRVLTKVKPNNFNELSAVISLFRPGPVDNIDQYVRNKNNSDNIEYVHPNLESILKDTYGIIVYQEQVIQILQKVANFSLAESDLIRRSIAKKDEDLLVSYQRDFINGAVNNGYNYEVAVQLFDYIKKFANYGFNKSHSISYSHISYLMAYLKSNHLNIFMAVMLKHNLSDKTTVNNIIKTLNEANISLLKPNVNESTNNFIIKENSILTSLSAVKLISEKIADQIITIRKAKPFTNFTDFKERTKHIITKDMLINLIYSGALDTLGINRRTMIELIDLDLLTFGKIVDDLKIPEYKEYNQQILIQKQQEQLGFIVK